MKRLIGIDLGTTNCCIAWVDGNEVVVYRDEQGQSTIPSIVAQNQAGDIMAGWRAKNCKDPLYRHGFAKRDLGSARDFQFKDKTVKAAGISAELLKELKARAEAALKCEVAAVITVPAHFQQTHREETRQAAQEAGLELLDLLPEPIAAAIAYYHDESARSSEIPPEETILVYDLGGGTMDATVCVRRGQQIEVGAFGRAYEGDKFLGGVDFDKALVGMAARQLKGQGFETGALGQQLPSSQWLWELMTSAERIKQTLSDETETQWSKELVSRDPDRQATLNFWLTRAEFEKEIKHLVDKTLEYCDQALLHHARRLPGAKQIKDKEGLLRLAAEKLDRIILVGGSTLVPCIRRRVQEHYEQLCGQAPEIRRFRPYECVAIGAAIYAATRGIRPPSAPDQIIRWLSGPQEQVGKEVSLHPALAGVVANHGKSGWTIELKVGAQTFPAEVQSDGRFRLPAFPLAEGENQLELTLFDDRRKVCGRQTLTILRGGLNIIDPGLAHPISVRLVDGTRVLLKASARAGVVQTEPLFINDRSAKARAPLYESHYPIGEIEFSANAEPGDPVIFRTLYRQGKLEVEVQIGERPPEKHQLKLEAIPQTREQGKLYDDFRSLLRETESFLANVPQQGQLADQLRHEWAALKLDIDTEFANIFVLDLSRIEDRVRQLELLQFQLQAFSTTAEGLRQRVQETKEMLGKHEGVDDLLARLDEIEAEINDEQHAEELAALATQLRGVRYDLNVRYPPEINQEMIAFMEEQLRGRLKDIRRNATDDPASLQEATEVEAEINNLLASGNDTRTIFHRLLVFEQEHVNELYQKVVIRKGQQGLLRGAK